MGLPTRPETRANWLGDMRPAWESRESAAVIPWDTGHGPQEGPARAASCPCRGKCGKGLKGLYLGSPEELSSLQVGENGRDAVWEWVAQEGGILWEEKGRADSSHSHGAHTGRERAMAQGEAPGGDEELVGINGQDEANGPRYGARDEQKPLCA